MTGRRARAPQPPERRESMSKHLDLYLDLDEIEEGGQP